MPEEAQEIEMSAWHSDDPSRPLVSQGKGKAPRMDAEAMRVMVERDVVRSVKEDLGKQEILELLKPLSIDWGIIASVAMPLIDLAKAEEIDRQKAEEKRKKDEEDRRKEEWKLREKSHLKSFNNLDLDDPMEQT